MFAVNAALPFRASASCALPAIAWRAGRLDPVAGTFAARACDACAAVTDRALASCFPPSHPAAR
jgi:hypothetical protein